MTTAAVQTARAAATAATREASCTTRCLSLYLLLLLLHRLCFSLWAPPTQPTSPVLLWLRGLLLRLFFRE